MWQMYLSGQAMKTVNEMAILAGRLILWHLDWR